MGWGSDLKSFFKIPGAVPLIAGMFLYGIGIGILAPMNAVYMRDSIGLSKVEIAAIFSISLILNMSVTIIIGRMSDSIKKKKMLPIVALVFCMAGLLIYMRAGGFTLTLIGVVLSVAPSGLIMGQLFAMARSHFMLKAAAFFEMAQIWLRATFSVGFFIGLLAGANIYLIAGFRGVLWGNFLGYALLLALLLFYREHEDIPARNESLSEPFSLAMLAAILLLSCADSLRGLYLPLVVVHLFRETQVMSYLWSVQAIFELLFMTLAGYWSVRYGSERVIIVSGFLAFAVYLVYSASPPLHVFFLVQPVYSFFVSVLYGVAMGYVQRMFHTRIGFGSSLYVFITQAASLVGYVLPFIVPGYQPTLFVIPAVLVLLAVLLMWSAVRLRRNVRLPG